MNASNKILKGDRVIWIIAILLGIVSLIVVYSAASALVTRNYDGNTGRMLMKHAGTLFLGYVCMFIAYKIDYTKYTKISPFALIICIIALVYTMFFGARLNNASRSISLGGFSLQPSEFAKIALITYLATMLVVLKEKLSSFKFVFWLLFIPIFGTVGCIFSENLSTAALLLFVCMVLLFIGNVKFMHILAITGIMVGAFGCYILYDNIMTNIKNNKAEKAVAEALAKGEEPEAIKMRQSRVETWINRLKGDDDEDADPFNNHNYQQTFAKIAVGTSSFFGKGPGKSEQRNFLPHPYSDFIFAIIIEEYGLFGAGIVILLYLILFFRVIRITSKRPMSFASYLSLGLGMLVVTQALINMGVSVTILPVTGQPLPFISMGGSSIMATGILIGMILSVTKSIEAEEVENIEIETENTDSDERQVESRD